MVKVYIHSMSDEEDEWCVWVDGSDEHDDEYYEDAEEAQDQADSLASELNCEIKRV